MFFKGSRYAKVAEHEITTPEGRVIRYKRIRFIPETRSQVAHVVSQGERLDHLAYRYFRNPELFWRLCDANRTVLPDDLVAEPGKKILIPATED
jgi:hypothetical protein